MPAPSLASLPPRPQRRVISVSALFALLICVVSAFPLLIFGAAVLDIAHGVRRWRSTRLVLFATAILFIEAGGVLCAGGLWVVAWFGTTMKRPSIQHLHDRLEYWWTSSLLEAARAFAGLEIEISGLELASPGNAIVLGRHRSLPDAVLPAVAFGSQGLRLKYVLAGGLQWGPCLDIVGNRMDNHFLDRSPGSRGAEIGPIRALASRLDERSVAVLFPEGTFFTPERREKSLRRIAERRPDELERAEALRHLLPPRPAGCFALLDGAPTADVILMAHVGFETLATVKEIARAIPAIRPVRVQLWRIPRSEIPEQFPQRLDWLFDQWAMLDQWIDDNV